MDSSSVVRVSHLFDFTKDATCEDFMAQHPDPALIIMGSGAGLTGDEGPSDEFLTQRAGSVDVFEHLKKKSLLDPNAPVFFLVKKPGNNSFSRMIIIGRVPKCDIYLGNPTISKMHAYVTWTQTPEGKTYQLVDSRSSNGSWVNKTKLVPNQPMDLHDGDLVGLGGVIFLRFVTPQSLFSSLTARLR
jgi:hypothetical protein